MDNKKVVQNIVTKDSLVRSLRDLGVETGMILEVHTSLSSFGFVLGGARTVVDALLEAVGEDGTILMPVQTGDNTDPSSWVRPPVDPAFWKQIREEMPAYDVGMTDLRGMGDIADNFRHRPGVICSSHPSLSYAAYGRYAKLLCNRQSLHFPLAEESPTARLYELKGHVLLLGTDLTTCTCLHLAEYRTEARPIHIQASSIRRPDGTKEWKKYLDLDLDSSDFEKFRPAFESKGLLKEAMIGDCKATFFAANEAIDEAMHYFEKETIYDFYR